jgi:hypothetical protein
LQGLYSGFFQIPSISRREGTCLHEQRITQTELEYRILAINQAGIGSPSNTVMVVL